jgi:hypothetical protein
MVNCRDALGLRRHVSALAARWDMRRSQIIRVILTVITMQEKRRHAAALHSLSPKEPLSHSSVCGFMIGNPCEINFTVFFVRHVYGRIFCKHSSRLFQTRVG